MNQRLDWHDWLRSERGLLWMAFGLAGFDARILVGVLDGVFGDDPRHGFHVQLPAYVPD